jgi:hypothetical protein
MLVSAGGDSRRTRGGISRELRECWPAVARPEKTASSERSSNVEVVFGDQPLLANVAETRH